MRQGIIKSIVTTTALIFALTMSAQEKRFGVTTISVTQHREKPDFTAELGNQILCGTPVEIIDSQSYWRKIKSPEPYTAWCVDLAVKEMSKTELEVYLLLPKMICIVHHSCIFSKPSDKSERITDVVQGDILINNGVNKGKFTKVSLADGRSGYIKKKDVRDFQKWAEDANASTGNIIETAKQYIGIPYVWGGTSINGLDCSGFIRMIWYMNGVLLPRNASQQALIGEKIDIHANTSLFPVENSSDYSLSPEFKEEMLHRIENLIPGDLIFFGRPGKNGENDKISHVGLYLGEGKFIHASKYVRINSLIPNTDSWYEGSKKMITACRIIGNEGSKGITKIIESPCMISSYTKDL